MKKSVLIDEDKKRQHGFKNIFRMLKFYKKEWIKLIIYTILVIAESALGICYPIIEKNFLAGVFARDWGMFLKFFIIYGIIESADVVLWALKGIVYTVAQQGIWYGIKKNALTRIFPLSQKKLDNENSGKLYNRIHGDINDVTTIYTYLVDSSGALISATGRLFVLFTYSWQLSIYIFVVQLILFGIDTYIRKVRMYYRRANKRLSDESSGLYHGAFNGLKDIKCLNMEAQVNQKMEENMTQSKNIHIERTRKLNLLNSSRSFLWGIFYVGFGLLSYYFLKNSFIMPEIFAVFYMNYGVVGRVFRNIQDMLKEFNEKELSAERVLELYDETLYPQDKFGDKVLENVKGHIEVKDLTFGYSDDKILFEHLSLDFAPNKVTAIVGKSGEGKSSIANILFHLYDWQAGSITIDNIDIRELSKESFRSIMSIIPQNPYIFNFSVRENLLLVRPNATDEELWQVLEKAQLADYIRELEQGLDTVVGENGVQMSGGQKQRLAIARALLKDSPIMVFDEATSALDNYAQGKIQASIEGMRTNHTVIIIAHRLSTIKDADKIIVLGNHTVVDEGTCRTYETLRYLPVFVSKRKCRRELRLSI